MKVNSIENELIILTKQTVDIFLKTDNPADVMALYTFYYYTAKWQETNQPKCTTNYVANGLKWSEARVRKIKKELLELGLIEDVQKKDDSGKIVGHYIKLNYIIKQKTLNENHTVEKPQGGNAHRVESVRTNALSTNKLNALNTNNKNALSELHKNIVEYLNQKANTNYKPSTKKTKELIDARLHEGFTLEHFKIVIDKKCDDWLGTDFEQYLRPLTLFSPKFESYLNSKVTKKKTYGAAGVEVKKNDDDDLDGIL